MRTSSKLAWLAGALVATTAASALLTSRGASKAKAMVPPVGKFIDLGRSRVHYVETGNPDGPPLVMLAGLGGQLQHFTYDVVPKLTDTFRIFVLDRPGTGYSPLANDEDARLAQQARIVNDFIATYQLDRPLVVGHSLGGAIALKLALDYPHSVSGLVLLAPLASQQPIPLAYRSLAIRPAWVRNPVTCLYTAPLLKLVGSSGQRMIFHPQQPPRDFSVKAGAALLALPANFSTVSLELSTLSDDIATIENRYGELALPVGALFGAADSVLDTVRHRRALLSIPGIEIEALEGEGHMITVSRADDVATFIRRTAVRCFGNHAARQANGSD